MNPSRALPLLLLPLLAACHPAATPVAVPEHHDIIAETVAQADEIAGTPPAANGGR